MAVVGERWPNTEFLSDSCSFGSVRTLWDQPFESYEEALVPVASGSLKSRKGCAQCDDQVQMPLC